MKRLLLTSLMLGTWMSAAACGSLGTGDDPFGDGDGDVSLGDGDGDSPGDGDLGLAGGPGDGDLGDGDAVGGEGGMAGDGDLGGDGDLPIDPSVPLCTITSPQSEARIAFHGERTTNSAEPENDTSGITFKATATDLEDGALSGESIAWYRATSEVDELLGYGSSLTVEQLPPGENTIVCEATDSDEQSGFDEVTVTSLSPVLYIDHPGDLDGPRSSEDNISFVAVGFDYEDGVMNESSFVWRSDIDGEFGEGNGEYSLSPGQHKITVTGTDEDGNQGMAYVYVTVL